MSFSLSFSLSPPPLSCWQEVKSQVTYSVSLPPSLSSLPLFLCLSSDSKSRYCWNTENFTEAWRCFSEQFFKLFDPQIKPVLLYGSEIWGMQIDLQTEKDHLSNRVHWACSGPWPINLFSFFLSSFLFLIGWKFYGPFKTCALGPPRPELRSCVKVEVVLGSRP